MQQRKEWEPSLRPRRLRRNQAIRDLTQETFLRSSDFIAPLFVKDGTEPPTPIGSMPGIYRLSIPDLLRECRELFALGIRGVALFPVTPPELKNPTGTEALDPSCLVLRAIRAIKDVLPTLIVFTDIALDPYTTHGHDGILTSDGLDVDNDATVDLLAQMAVLHAKAGVDFVAPSDMMDGRVRAIRQALDGIGQGHTGILAYSAKFASAFYGPFRDAVGSAAAAGTRSLDKRTYQLNPANRREAIADALLDEEEGADALMVKPAGPYLDVIAELRQRTLLPLAAYQVSGEYAQIHAAAQHGWLDLARARDESLMAIKRAGADWILTYFAKDMARTLPD
ncbi:MAG TPA: porphobilinogen synthase [Candidatus Limnocylindria bacterium]|nr:porphobilinogen synthase [Candidatus Limnocylindria bacterium]